MSNDIKPDGMAAALRFALEGQEAHRKARVAAEAEVVRLTAERDAAAAGERARIAAWLHDDAGKTRDDLTRLNRSKKLTAIMNAEWEAVITVKAGIASAIEANTL